MFIDINKIAPEGDSFEADLASSLSGRVDEREIEIRQALISGRVSTDEEGTHLEGSLDAVVVIPCSRCLEPCRVEISTDFLLKLVPEAVEFGSGELRVEKEDTILYYMADGRVDLEEMTMEQIRLNMPLKQVCSTDCLGLCPECGANRNENRCDCGDGQVDPRLAPLLKLRKE